VDLIVIGNDGLISPFGLYLLRDSKFQLLAPTRDIKEESDEFDGEIDFGTELAVGFEELRCVTEDGLSNAEKASKKAKLAEIFNNLRENGDWLVFENLPGKKKFVRLDGRVNIEEYSTWLRVDIPLKYDPLWVGTEEKQRVGSGIIVNEGNFETPLIIAVKGIIVDPEIVVGDEVLKYNGTVGSADVLIIDTGNQTVTFNGVNALSYFEGNFPKIQPGETEVVVPSEGTTIFCWNDRWL